MTTPATITQTIPLAVLPEKVRQADPPPIELYVRTRTDASFQDLPDRPRVAIVGSRDMTPYGQEVTHRLASQLAARGVVIVSGMALGIDATAHRAAIQAGGLTMAVLPSPVDNPYPRHHWRLANDILECGGALVSEYPSGMPALIHHFVERNRLVAALADIRLITEATANSGTTHTATYARNQGMDVLAVPGNILSRTSAGPNNLLKEGAHPVTGLNDVIYVLNQVRRTHLTDSVETEEPHRARGANDSEQQILDLIERGISDDNQLLAQSGFSVELFNHHLTMLEITAKVRPLGANHWAVS